MGVRVLVISFMFFLVFFSFLIDTFGSNECGVCKQRSGGSRIETATNTVSVDLPSEIKAISATYESELRVKSEIKSFVYYSILPLMIFVLSAEMIQDLQTIISEHRKKLTENHKYFTINLCAFENLSCKQQYIHENRVKLTGIFSFRSYHPFI